MKLVANEFEDLLVFKQTKKYLGYRHVSLHMTFYMDVGDLNLGLNAYIAGADIIETCSKPLYKLVVLKFLNVKRERENG